MKDEVCIFRDCLEGRLSMSFQYTKPSYSRYGPLESSTNSFLVLVPVSMVQPTALLSESPGFRICCVLSMGVDREHGLYLSDQWYFISYTRLNTQFLSISTYFLAVKIRCPHCPIPPLSLYIFQILQILLNLFSFSKNT